jgi:hypothetical protein
VRLPNDAPAWIVAISDASGKLEYQDTDSDFIGTLMVYWCWDQEDRVWLYNSDDGKVWYWERKEGMWLKTLWGRRDEKHAESQPQPPSEVFPPYAS